MGFLGGLFKRREETREELIKQATDLMVETDAKPDYFFDLFGNEPLAKVQTVDGALAEWHAQTVSCTHYALAASLSTADKISPFIGMYRSAFAKRLKPECRNIFVQIVPLREKEYVKAIFETLKSGDSAQALGLFGSMARRITGHHDEELEKAGLPADFGGPDIIKITAFSYYAMARINATKESIDRLQVQLPRLFTGPMS
jgi:hypothetical protein